MRAAKRVFQTPDVPRSGSVRWKISARPDRLRQIPILSSGWPPSPPVVEHDVRGPGALSSVAEDLDAGFGGTDVAIPSTDGPPLHDFEDYYAQSANDPPHQPMSLLG